MLYEAVLKRFFFCLAPETAHDLAVTAVSSFLGAATLPLQLPRARYDAARMRTEMCGIPIENPVGLAAGFDKNAQMFSRLDRLGFGYAEIGTVTAKAQAGNPKPRLFRLPEDRALINRMGFNNHGADVIAERLASKPSSIPIGGNIGKSKVTPLEQAVEDYTYTFKLLKPLVDYFVVNVSSPNTPGLRQLQEREPLKALLGALMELNREPRLPLLLKIAPDLNESQLEDIVDVVEATGVDGVIATNTTIERGGLKTPESRVSSMGAGGLSGRPLRERATEVVRFLRERLPSRVSLIGVGGISSGADAYEKIRAGAACVQIYTSFIYRGPGTVIYILNELDELLRRDGFATVGEAVGADLR
ncbi:quinone-dependent dihydroorotate dehydrogenase [Sulfidibacter corallicola]|uniref:Dihydroorotate dehydrogenase (quinone) n=1 Tax=Sulfidibacter corallicola TaxID=2818388 RepID=A0A8A4TFZ5_SULCO|nr:quinone-dependent dihydroorotate dehydrogenase [Sulfidibacter corallicola]QTD48112.1 quinone-dependent dihydroorotate dehydrogenase [Sulfidibacter corallicola]